MVSSLPIRAICPPQRQRQAPHLSRSHQCPPASRYPPGGPGWTHWIEDHSWGWDGLPQVGSWVLCFLSKFSCPFLPQLELVGKPSVLPCLPQSPSPTRPDPWALSQFPKFVDTVWKQDLHLYSMLEKKNQSNKSSVAYPGFLSAERFCEM